MQHVAYLYTLPGCEACVSARSMVLAQGFWPVDVPIDNPALEVGIKLLFKDGQVHAPVIWIPERGVYILSHDEPPQMLRILALEPQQ